MYLIKYIICFKEKKGPMIIPDIIFLHLIMPVVGGWEFLERLKQIKGWPKKTDIYILSALANSKDRAMAKVRPLVQGYFAKPLSKAIVESVLQKKIL